MTPLGESVLAFGVLVLVVAAAFQLVAVSLGGPGAWGSAERFVEWAEPPGVALAFGALIIVVLAAAVTETVADLPGTAFLVDGQERQNVAKFASAGLLLCAAAMAAFLARETRASGSDRLWWALLALVLFALAFDESAAIHERIAQRLDVNDALPLVPLGIAAAIGLVGTLPVARRFPPAAVLYAAAIGVGLGSQVIDVVISSDVEAKHLAEEPLEMLASLLLILAFLTIARARVPSAASAGPGKGSEP